MANLLSRWGKTTIFPAYVEFYDDGSVVFSANGSTAYTFTSSVISGLAKISGFVWDLTGATTGAAYVSITDNLAAAFQIKEGSNVYLTAKTTDNKEALVVGKLLHEPMQAAIDMADATHTLVLGTAVAAQTKLTSRYLFVDANSSGTEQLKLVPVADFVGALTIFNIGGESIVLKDSNGADTLINSGGGLTIAAGKIGFLVSSGSGWFGNTT